MAFSIKTGDVIREIEWVVDRVLECTDLTNDSKNKVVTALMSVADELKGVD